MTDAYFRKRPRHVPEIEVRHIAPQDYVEYEVNSRAPMRIRVAYLGQVPDTDKASIGIQVEYAGHRKNEDG